MALVREAGEVPLRLGEDAMISLRIDPAPNIEAPIVFAGYGLSIPEASHNDFNDLDANGKIVVYLPVNSLPTTLPSAGGRSSRI